MSEWNDAIEAAKAACHDVATGKINPKTDSGGEPACAEFACMIALDALKRKEMFEFTPDGNRLISTYKNG